MDTCESDKQDVENETKTLNENDSKTLCLAPAENDLRTIWGCFRHDVATMCGTSLRCVGHASGTILERFGNDWGTILG